MQPIRTPFSRAEFGVDGEREMTLPSLRCSIGDGPLCDSNSVLSDRPVLSVEELRTHFYTREGVVRAVDGATFSVGASRVLGVVGESGCGKSVTAQSILRIVTPPGRIVGGRILLRRALQKGVTNKTIDETDLATLDPQGEMMRNIRGGEIAMVFQEPMTSLDPLYTIGNQLLEAITLHQEITRGDARSHAIDMLRRVGMPRPRQAVDSYAHQLSGGMRQRAMIAIALSCSPRVLVADEPTTALDVTTEAQILDLMKRLQEEAGTSIVYITHDLGVVAEMCDDVVVMYLGKVVERGEVQAVFSNPLHPYTQALLRSIPRVVGEVKPRLEAIKGMVPDPFDMPTGCPFWPRCSERLHGICDQVEPSEISVEPGHSVRCVRYGDPVVGQPSVLASERLGEPRTGNNTATPSVTTEEPKRHSLPKSVSVAEDVRPLLDVEGLRKHFPIQRGFLRRTVGWVKAVDGVSFHIRPGETFGLVGESGCGKTTVGRCLLRLMEPTGGKVIFDDQRAGPVNVRELDGRHMRAIRRNIQIIFQDPYSSLSPRLTLKQIVGEPLVVNNLARGSDLQAKVAETLRAVGLRSEYMDRYPHAFSGGQRQRISLARALVLNPQLIVADEPVSALDVSVQAQVLNLMQDLQEEYGLTYLFISHNLSVIKHVCDRVAVMYVGKMVEVASTGQLFESPRHPYTEALLSAVPNPDPEVRRPRRIVLAGEVADPSSPPSGCYFHPRCRYATSQCTQVEPDLVEIEPGHWVRCHLAGEIALRGVQ